MSLILSLESPNGLRMLVVTPFVSVMSGRRGIENEIVIAIQNVMLYESVSGNMIESGTVKTASKG